MIFGLTHDQRARRAAARWEKLKQPRTIVPWWPRRLQDGRFVWREPVCMRAVYAGSGGQSRKEYWLPQDNR